MKHTSIAKRITTSKEHTILMNYENEQILKNQQLAFAKHNEKQIGEMKMHAAKCKAMRLILGVTFYNDEQMIRGE